ncbi:pyruvate oxidase [Methanolinea mesophila]|uniref:thiamine pyrophosphate-dependent enzyme n=1 Tax=Methanolinea mesophila TaxID=547055 RepID=UPI001AE4A8FE|nr:thiamine pyrophosphate-dependent enzyme [Methanolinea mesophila]MBP1927751.1 pyruvate oxidase [Methanolinea mesophila]
MARWKCSVCGYIYSEEKGEPATKTPPHTRFSDLPDAWKCPVCGAAKSAFVEIKEEEALHEASGSTVSDALISEMVAWGVTLVFGLPGTSSLGLVDAIRKNPNMQYIVVRHEENAAMAASAFNKLTGKIAACLTIAGPGATNLSTGLYDAKEDGASVLSLNGQVESQYTGPFGIQEIDQDAFFRSVSVYNNTVYERNKTILLLNLALKYATLHHGVAQISVPNDIQKQNLEISCCRKEICIASPHIVPDENELAKAAAAIDQAQNAVIIAGWGAYGGGDAIAALAEKIKAPILTTYRAKGILPEDHPWVVGVLGSVGSPQARALTDEADLLITLGVGFSKFTNIPTDKALIQVDTNPVKLGKGPLALPLWGNCALTIPKLTGMVKTHNKDVLPRIREMKRDWQEQLDREADPTAVPVRPPYIMKVLSETVPEDAVITVDVGENQWWFGRNFRMKRQRFAMSGYLATMGFGFPAAIAAKIAYPEKQVVCITGDGGFSQAMSDFVTTVKYHLPMVVVVLNNKQLGMIQVEQLTEHYPNYGTDLLNPDFAAYAEVCGGKGITVKRPGELKAALIRAMSLDTPVIVDVDTDPKRF